MKVGNFWPEENNPLLSIALSLLSFLAYVLTFKLTTSLPYSLKYAGWIYLIFLPAGSKLICIMLFGIWGTIGDAFALYWMSTQFLPNVGYKLWAIYAVTSSLMTFIAIRFAMKSLSIRNDLGNLHFWQMPFMSLIGAGIHGFITILVMVEIGLVRPEDYWSSSFAIITGDFIGIFLVLLGFGLITKSIGLFRDIAQG